MAAIALRNVFDLKIEIITSLEFVKNAIFAKRSETRCTCTVTGGVSHARTHTDHSRLLYHKPQIVVGIMVAAYLPPLSAVSPG
jgi:hypothetical protein